ncbi:MAG: PDR/VanB family oxidoreductase [Marinosulfonomonas sp.]|nr:PDR/VanB family oxidoreductase [Marinosulfonomonas sp.]
MPDDNQTRALVVSQRRALTDSITEFTLQLADGGPLPGFTPGAHVTVQTPSKAMRRYSLVNDGAAPNQYVLAIKREPKSRGGSQSMFDSAPEGVTLQVSDPENSFKLVPAPKYLLIAGGIGITPIQAMAHHLAAQGTPFQLVYCTMAAPETAYLEEMRALGSAVTIHHDNADPEQLYDFWDHFEKPDASHVYCCGPAPMMEEIKALAGFWPEGRVHFEEFKPVEIVRADDVAFTVTLARSGKKIDVPADRSILEAMRDAGEKTVSSCESGVCGTCKCGLIEGDVDHRDSVLLDEERGTMIMTCVSRASSGDLVLDL